MNKYAVDIYSDGDVTQKMTVIAEYLKSVKSMVLSWPVGKMDCTQTHHP